MEKEKQPSKEELLEKFRKEAESIEDDEIWSLDCNIAEYALPRLYKFRMANNFCNGNFFDKEELDKIIFSMEHMVLFGNGFNFGHLEEGKKETQKDRDKVHEGLILFGEKFWTLWI